MSQRKEKFARSLERRVETCENAVYGMRTRLDYEDRFRDAALAIQKQEVTAEADRQIGRRQREAERNKKRSYLIARISLILALAVVVLFLTVFAGEGEQKSTQTGKITTTAAEYHPKAQLLSADNPPEDYENLYIEQALIQQEYYRDDVPLSYELQDVMQSACTCYGVPYSLALAVCQTESSFDQGARNGECIGYMQIHSINFERLSEATYGANPRQPNGNITCGVYLLGELLDKYDDTTKALMAYNCGRTGAAKLWKQGIASTEYTRTVEARADQWQQLLNN